MKSTAQLVIILLAEIFIGSLAILTSPWVSIICLLFTILVILFFFRPYWILYLCIVFVPMRFCQVSINSNYAPSEVQSVFANLDLHFFILLLGVLALLLRFGAKTPCRVRRASVVSPIIHYCLLIFTFWCFASIFWAPNFFIGLIQYVKLLTNVVLFFIFYLVITSEKQLKRVTFAFIILGVLLTIASLVSVYVVSLPEEIASVTDSGYIFEKQIPLLHNIGNLDEVNLDIYWRIQRDRGTAFCSPHKLSLLQNCLVAFTLGLSLIWTNKRLIRHVFIGLLIACMVYSHATAMSKGGTASLLALIFFIFFFSDRFRQHFVRNVIVFVGLLMLSFFILQSAQDSQVASARYSAESVEQISFATRIEYWETVLIPFFKSYGIGLGVGGSSWFLSPVGHTHNVYLSILSDTGFIGTILLFIVFLVILKEAMPVIKRQETFSQCMVIASGAALLAVLIHSLVDFSYHTSEFWMFAGFGLAALKIAKQELVYS